MFQRASGVLLPVFSLPGEFGIGSFGKEAQSFIDLLADMGCGYWQILPLCPADQWNSPYKSVSAFAGNRFFIDLNQLAAQGLLTAEELAENIVPEIYSVSYDFLAGMRLRTLRKAFNRLTEQGKQAAEAFMMENSGWAPDYCLYMALREENGGREWNEWDAPLRQREPEAMEEAKTRLREEVLFYAFIQQTFFNQWVSLKEYANRKNVKIIGDMPIYVSFESADVWSNRGLFDLTEDGAPREVAGVPPDYFAVDGQKWGNPLYNWQAMSEDGYQWWVRRLQANLSMYDAVRIDHFRAFSAYWAVPAADETARNGVWKKGPGIDFFEHVFQSFDDPKIIAEDLGCIDDDVRTLIWKTGLPGMRVMQFGFLDENDNEHLPHNYTKNSIAYTGTHDNTTMLGWLWEAGARQRENALEYCNFSGNDWSQGGPHSESCHALVRTLWQSAAELAIVPVQDLLGYGGDTRINRPGQAHGNWEYRVTQEDLKQIDRNWMRKLNNIYKRTN